MIIKNNPIIFIFQKKKKNYRHYLKLSSYKNIFLKLNFKGGKCKKRFHLNIKKTTKHEIYYKHFFLDGQEIWLNISKSLRDFFFAVGIRAHMIAWLIEVVHRQKHMLYQSMIFVCLMFVNSLARLNTLH